MNYVLSTYYLLFSCCLAKCLSKLVWARCALESTCDAFDTRDYIFCLLSADEGGDAECIACTTTHELNIVDDACSLIYIEKDCFGASALCFVNCLQFKLKDKS